MKARKVKGLDRTGPLAANAARIVLTRLGELRELATAALDEDASTEQHDARIAAKRLRYVLEATGFCFGDAGDEALRAARELQGILGDLHDCDELLPEIARHTSALRAEDAAAVHQAAGEDAALDPALAAKAPNRTAYRGLAALASHTAARRRLEFAKFTAYWDATSSEGVWDRLESAARGANLA